MQVKQEQTLKGVANNLYDPTANGNSTWNVVTVVYYKIIYSFCPRGGGGGGGLPA